MKFDLNCDLGEGEPLAHTRALMQCITSANVACGGHAGDAGSMKACVQLAKEHGVHLGAHPGFNDRANFGRVAQRITDDELELLLSQQIGALDKIAVDAGMPIHHIKLHGALYHAVENEAALANAYVKFVQRWSPSLIIYAQSGGLVVRQARNAKVRVWEEAFVDRGYQDNGLLVPRQSPGALVEDVTQAEQRVREHKSSQCVTSVNGQPVPLKADTWCLHADSPNALPMARALRRLIGE